MATASTMSVAVAGAEEQPYQPFQCLICQSRFTRHENLKRHAAVHTRPRDKSAYTCDLCPTTFSRRDLQHRHMKRKHPEHEEAAAAKRFRPDPVTATKRSGRRSRNVEVFSAPSADGQSGFLPQQWGNEPHVEVESGAWPLDLPDEPADYSPSHHHSPASSDSCSNAASAPANIDRHGSIVDFDRTQQPSALEPIPPMQSSTNLDLSASLGTPIFDFGFLNSQFPSAPAFDRLHPSPGSSPQDLSLLEDHWHPSSSQITRGLDLYFSHASHFVPFLHQPTFDVAGATRGLVLSILCLAYQHGEDPDCDDEAGSGDDLSRRCFQHARALLSSEEEGDDDLTRNVETVQAYLLLEICAVVYMCGKESAYGLKMHSKMITLARSCGLTQPAPSGAAASKDLESLWSDFIRTESHKRTIFAAHQIDALWYQLLSIPRSLSHLEIKHELPCPVGCWTAASASEWALRQLTTRNSSDSVQYADAVRRFLSPSSDLESLPSFDPYGAINIAQFLLSSAREVSGWSAITGRLSLDRLEPLKASLVALGPSIRSQAGSDTDSSSTALHTFEIAMIELQIWSPSHTCGRIEGSVDAVLRESTILASAGDISFGAETAQAVQPHITWFLRYLDETRAPDSEPPWISLYAYKAFLIAWQLVRKGIPGAMEVVRVQDGDVDGALAWARDVFGRRRRRKVGRLIGECLETLSR